MNEKNFFMTNQQSGGYYPYYQPTSAPMMRPEQTTYQLPQMQSIPILKGRPVSSLEEARVAQIDLDGSIFIFPNLGNQKIYTKRINADGTATIQTFSLDFKPAEEENNFATKTEVQELKNILDEIMNKLKTVSNTGSQPKINF